MTNATKLPRWLLLLTAIYAVLWCAAIADWRWIRWIERSELLAEWIDAWIIHLTVFLACVALAGVWLGWSLKSVRRSRVLVLTVLTPGFIVCWQALLYSATVAGWEFIRAHTARLGTAAMFFIGLAWLVWLLERTAQRREAERAAEVGGELAYAQVPASNRHASRFQSQRVWSPLDPAAWYYGKRKPRLNQSVSSLATYSLVFFLIFLLLTQIGGCSEIFELPAGGGELAQVRQKVKIQKVKRIKYVLNPESVMKFRVPPIEEIRMNFRELTKHLAKVGQGEGEGAGFAAGTKSGKVRLMRLEYSGGDWQLGMGIGQDWNMLNKYAEHTGHKVAKQSESRPILALRAFRNKYKSPPLVFMTGTKGLSTSRAEEKVLREYLLDKHGMVFASAGSSQFGRSFRAMMQRVLPNVRPVVVALDDPIHTRPFGLLSVPFVAPHDGRQALGWKKDGRWVCYYHPGDIVDAWADDHAGIAPEIWQGCYYLGTNVIAYAYSEYSKWVQQARGK